MSKKNLVKALAKAENDRASFLKYSRSRSRADRIRYLFLNERYYRALYAANPGPDTQRKYEQARAKYDALFPSESFSRS